ncbi:MAG: hypothetical protein R6X34_11030 [Chloroflexota bacterium]
MNELRTSVGRLQTAVSPPSAHRFPQTERSGSASQMAAAILARYGRGTALWQSLSPVFLEMGMGETAVTHHHHHAHHAHTQLRPRLNLVLVQPTQRSDAESASPESPRPASTPDWQSKRPIQGVQKMTILAERLQRQESEQHTAVQVLTRRLNQQHQPLDILSGQPRPVLAAAQEKEGERKRPFTDPLTPPAMPSQAAPRILRQPPRQPAAKAEAPPTRQPETAAPFGASRWEMGNKQIVGTETAVDINRLTDEVMQKLEYRLQAHRERTGRF